MTNDYYALLGIPDRATHSEIELAIRKARRKWISRQASSSLERRVEAERRVHMLDEAERILLDPQNRRRYDAKRELMRTRQRAHDQQPIEPSTHRRVPPPPPLSPTPVIEVPELYAAQLFGIGLPTLCLYYLITLALPHQSLRSTSGSTHDPSFFFTYRPFVIIAGILIVGLALIIRRDWAKKTQRRIYVVAAASSLVAAMCCATGAQFFFMAQALDTRDPGAAFLAIPLLLGGIITLIAGCIGAIFFSGRSVFFLLKAS